MAGHNFKEIEKKWQKYWEINPYFAVDRNLSKPRFYCLDMFPYPSGSGLHMGHWRNYVLSDIYARQKFLQGFCVLHPMGWDAFGLPAENAAIGEGIHPKVLTERNVNIFRNQLKQIGAMYDWSRELNTTDPNYYKWTQWIFIKMFRAGLAYESQVPVNWCPSCKTGLANEESTDGKCDRCGSSVEQKPLRQWVLKITEFADQLDKDLDKLDWSEKVKLMQRNWIGKSFGYEVEFKSKESSIIVYTTRLDTIFGVSFIALAPEHPLLQTLVTAEQADSVMAYCQNVKHQSRLERQLFKEKTGVFLGSYATNPANGMQIPIYCSSFVLAEYGTGAVMGVPAHDQRDFEFAQKFGLEIKQVIFPENSSSNAPLEKAYEGEGCLSNSGQFNGLASPKEAIEKIGDWLSEQKQSKKKINYKLKDWIFSRQRYWGEPIPLIHCDRCGIIPVDDKDLPVLLPAVDNYQPTGTGESPLAAIESWVNTSCPSCKGAAKRETNTMPQWAGSCWYFLRYPNVELKSAAWNQETISQWLPVDLYVGGIEHAVLHLLYSRFYVKFLHSQGLLPFDEPFSKLFNQGMICMLSEKSGRVEKMSKSRGNVVNPDQMIEKYGSDALRLYILFMGPPEADVQWSEQSVVGVSNFLSRLATRLETVAIVEKADHRTTLRVNKFLKDFSERVFQFKPNTAVSAMMELYNDLSAEDLRLDKILTEKVLAGISIFIPHFASEFLEKLNLTPLEKCSWPIFDPQLIVEEFLTIPIQINGKLRATIEVATGSTEEEIKEKAKIAGQKWLEGKTIKKMIFVPGKLISFVV